MSSSDQWSITMDWVTLLFWLESYARCRFVSSRTSHGSFLLLLFRGLLTCSNPSSQATLAKASRSWTQGLNFPCRKHALGTHDMWQDDHQALPQKLVYTGPGGRGAGPADEPQCFDIMLWTVQARMVHFLLARCSRFPGFVDAASRHGLARFGTCRTRRVWAGWSWHRANPAAWASHASLPEPGTICAVLIAMKILGLRSSSLASPLQAAANSRRHAGTGGE